MPSRPPLNVLKGHNGVCRTCSYDKIVVRPPPPLPSSPGYVVCVAVDSNTGIWVIGGKGGEGKNVYVSSNPLSGNWTPKKLFGSGRCINIAVDSTTGIWVAVGNGERGNNIYVTDDPFGTWKPIQAFGIGGAGRCVAVDSTSGTWVVGGNDVYASTSTLYVSNTPLTNWTVKTASNAVKTVVVDTSVIPPVWVCVGRIQEFVLFEIFSSTDPFGSWVAYEGPLDIGAPLSSLNVWHRPPADPIWLTGVAGGTVAGSAYHTFITNNPTTDDWVTASYPLKIVRQIANDGGDNPTFVQVGNGIADGFPPATIVVTNDPFGDWTPLQVFGTGGYGNCVAVDSNTGIWVAGGISLNGNNVYVSNEPFNSWNPVQAFGIGGGGNCVAVDSNTGIWIVGGDSLDGNNVYVSNDPFGDWMPQQVFSVY